MYKIKEIFKSIQGEGFFSGRQAVFIRFSGCNLWNGHHNDRQVSLCQFCDTDFIGTNGKNGGRYTQLKLIEKIENVWKSSFSIGQKFVVLTGGEPLLQVDSNLLRGLKKKNFTVALETNGTIRTDLNFDWICVSPKENSVWRLKCGDELKIIYPQPKFDLKKISKLNFKYFFLQPMDNQIMRTNIYKTLEYCKSHKPWFPSFQLHKSLGVN